MKPAPALLIASTFFLLIAILLTAASPLPAGAAKVPTFENIKDLVWDGKQFVAVGRPGLVITSPDGVKWTQRSAGKGHELFTSIAWGNGSYAMIARYKGRDCTFTSQDALDWKRSCPDTLVGGGINRLRWVTGRFVAVGKKGLILASEDGEQWQRLESGTSENLIGVVGNEKNLLIIGQKGLVLKGDMKGSFTAHQQPKLRWRGSASEFHSPEVSNIAWNAREFITVGDAGHGSIFARSEDGENWDLKYFSGFNRLFRDIAWGNGLFVAIGSDIAVSTDGREWQFLNIREQDGTSTSLMHVITGGGRFLTTGLYGGNAFVSDDGFSWRGATKVALDPSGTTILPDKLAETRPVGEKKELVREMISDTFAQLLMSFGILGGSTLLFGYLQFKAIRRMRGSWLFFAVLPLIAGVGVVAITVFGFLTKANLWPIYLIFLMPAILLYLIIILLLHKLFCKKGPRQADEVSGDVM